MSDLKVIDKFQILSMDTGEITEIFNPEVPIKQRIDGIGYLKAQVESRIDLIKERVKDLTLDRKQLEDLLNDIKSATIDGLIESGESIARGLETKAWISERTKKLPSISDDLIPREQLEYTITVKNLSFEQMQKLHTIIWEGEGIPTGDVKIDSKVNVNRLNKALVSSEKVKIVSFSRTGATINE